MACPGIQEWYPLFSRRSIRTEVVALPEQFVAYLRAEGAVFLPAGTRATVLGVDTSQLSDDEVEYDNDEEDEDEDEDEAEGEVDVDEDSNNNNNQDGGGDGKDAGGLELQQTKRAAPLGQWKDGFPDLEQRIAEAIERLGGEVFPKLDDVAPTDAAWVNGGSLKCFKAGDIFLLLKSSDRCGARVRDTAARAAAATADTRAAAAEDSARPDLVLRKWANLHPAMAFRCFVRARSLVGISQRECTAAYDFLQDQQDELGDTIERFFKQHVKQQFPVPDFAMDVYVDKRKRVWIVDFAPFDDPTDPLLFAWEELRAAAVPAAAAVELAAASTDSAATEAASAAATTDGGTEEVPSALLPLDPHRHDEPFEFRIVEHSHQVLDDPLGASRGPVEATALMAGGFEDFMQKCKRGGHSSDGDEDDDATDGAGDAGGEGEDPR